MITAHPIKDDDPSCSSNVVTEESEVFDCDQYAGVLFQRLVCNLFGNAPIRVADAVEMEEEDHFSSVSFPISPKTERSLQDGELALLLVSSPVFQTVSSSASRLR